MQRLAAAILVALAAVACSDANPPVAPVLDGNAALANGQAKVTVCHVTDNGSYNAISIAAPAVPAHAAHGDGAPNSALPNNAGVFEADCRVARIVLDATTTFNTALGGGLGGSQFDDPCPAGSLVVGLSGDQVDYFGNAALFNHRVECRELRGDGTLGASSTTPARGPLFNIPPQNPYTGICSADGAIVGIDGFNHSLVNSIQGSCAGVSTVLAGGAPTSTVGPFTGFGFGFFQAYSLQCPANYVATGTIGDSGDVLDAVGLKCTKVVKITS